MFRIHRILLAYAVAIPLALVLGYLVATPDMASIALVGFVLFLLSLPLLIQWNHGLLIFFWNSAFVVGFLPGQLHFWLVFAGLAFGMGVVNRVMGHRNFLRAPELTKPILFLVVVVIVTAWIRGGVGLRAMGSESYGGKHYVYLLGAILGYFALTAQRIPVQSSARAVKWYFLSGLTYALPNLIYALGPAFYFLFFVVSTTFLGGQISSNWEESAVERFGGMGPAGMGLCLFMLARYGLKGVFEWNKPWRLLLVVGAVGACLFSGFRSQLVFLFMLFAVQFIIEGLWRTRLMPILICLGFAFAAPLLIFANKMPAAVQRAMAVLPLNIDPQVRQDTVSSSQWRFEMWRTVLPEIPKYLLVGKAYAIDPIDLYLTGEATRLGLLPSYSEAIVAGDYHSGGLSVLMTFGLFGTISFVWLLVAGVRVLNWNRLYGDPRLRIVNNALFANFLTLCLSFFLVYGQLDAQLYAFLGVLGLSISLNGGVCRKPAAKTVPLPISAAAMLQPA